MSGFVKIYRDLIGNPQFRGKDDEYAALWIICRAAWRETTVRVNRQPVTLQRGECAYALSYLADAWECSKATASARLRFLEKAGFVRTRAERGFTRIFVIKYDTYQADEQEARTQPHTPRRTQPEREPNAARTNKKEVKEKEEGEEERGRATRLPPDWSLPVEWEAWAVEQGHPNPKREAEKFRDYWIGVGGAKARKADWLATWRNWVRRSLENGAKQSGSGGGGGDAGADRTENRRRAIAQSVERMERQRQGSAARPDDGRREDGFAGDDRGVEAYPHAHAGGDGGLFH